MACMPLHDNPWDDLFPFQCREAMESSNVNFLFQIDFNTKTIFNIEEDVSALCFMGDKTMSWKQCLLMIKGR